MARPQKTAKCLKYVFSEAEIKALSYELARETRELRSLDVQRKEVAADFAGKVKVKEGIVDRTSEQIANGYEYRQIPCDIEYDDRRLVKTLTRSDTGETWEEPMEANERQQELPL